MLAHQLLGLFARKMFQCARKNKSFAGKFVGFLDRFLFKNFQAGIGKLFQQLLIIRVAEPIINTAGHYFADISHCQQFFRFSFGQFIQRAKFARQVQRRFRTNMRDA